jgi:hypothetical protein
MGGLQQDGCTYTRSHFAGGKIDIVGSCNNEGVSGSTSMKGSYSADRVDYVLDITMKVGAEPSRSRPTSRAVASPTPAPPKRAELPASPTPPPNTNSGFGRLHL